MGASNSGVGDTQTSVFVVAPPASASRRIGYVNYAGLVSFCQGTLDAISTTPSVPTNNNVWGAVWCASCGDACPPTSSATASYSRELATLP